MMGYNATQRSITVDQASRCHHFLHESQYILSEGFDCGQLVGYFDDRSLLEGMNNVRDTLATVSITTPASNILLNWEVVGGNGTFSTSNNGHVLDLTGLGTLALRVTWEENCLRYERIYGFEGSNSGVDIIGLPDF